MKNSKKGPTGNPDGPENSGHNKNNQSYIYTLRKIGNNQETE